MTPHLPTVASTPYCLSRHPPLLVEWGACCSGVRAWAYDSPVEGCQPPKPAEAIAARVAGLEGQIAVRPCDYNDSHIRSEDKVNSSVRILGKNCS